MAGKRGQPSSEEAKGSPARVLTGERESRESPLKRLKATTQQRAAARISREEIVLSIVEEFRAHIESREVGQAPNPDENVIVLGTVLWQSEHTFGERTLVLLHITDAEPEEPLDELTAFQDHHGASEGGRVAVDSLLLPAAIFGETLGSQNLPPNGQFTRIVNSRRGVVYDGKFCQLVTRCVDVSIGRD